MTAQSEGLCQILYDALRVNLAEFMQLTDNVIELLKNENGHIGNLKIQGRLVEVPPQIKATVIGDIHGDFETLTQILKSCHFVEKVKHDDNLLLIFLGDYGDRGELSLEVYYVVLKLKEAYSRNVVLMRGNHEGPKDLLASPHDLPEYLRLKFGGEWPKAYAKLYELWSQLYNGVLVNQRYIMLHGGVPSKAKSVVDLAYAHDRHPRETHLEEILWSDPEEGITGTFPSPRGAGRLFGEDVTNKFLRMLNVDVLIRGHEPSAEGYKINHDGRVLTLFSRKGEPYYNTQAAYLQLDLRLKVRNANQLRDFLRLL